MTNFDQDLIYLKGQRVSVICNGESWYGILNFAGINPTHGQYQVTIGRMPLWPVDKQTIKLYNI